MPLSFVVVKNIEKWLIPVIVKSKLIILGTVKLTPPNSNLQMKYYAFICSCFTKKKGFLKQSFQYFHTSSQILSLNFNWGNLFAQVVSKIIQSLILFAHPRKKLHWKTKLPKFEIIKFNWGLIFPKFDQVVHLNTHITKDMR